MKKILVIDTNYEFTTDVESRLILSDIEGVDVVTKNNINYIREDIETEVPTELLIEASILPSLSDWDFGLPMKSYARNHEGISLAAQRNIPCYGVIHTAKELLAAMESGQTIKVQNTQTEDRSSEHPTPTTSPATKPEVSVPAANPDSHTMQSDDLFQESQAPSNNLSQEEPKNPGLDDLFQNDKSAENGTAPKESVGGNRQRPYDDLFQNDKPIENGTAPKEPVGKNRPHSYPETTASDTFPYESPKTTAATSRQPVENPSPSSYQGDIRRRLAEAKAKEQEEERRRQMAVRKQQEDQAASAVNADLGNVKYPATVVTVYSAKGGVGKTTISTELATFLALTSHGRGKFNVCIVDDNIDFGDVVNTLSYDPSKACMTLWAADIREKLDSGMSPENIQYTEAQISVFLQRNDRDGLYALLAPITHEDSMDISNVEIDVMMDNLIHNGGFDFVICDTGNNTRDSSIIPLEKADMVLLVLTQDVNTANCNQNFLSTMQSIGFNMDKINLVINKTRPAKIVAISPEELAETFLNPNTNRPYPCLSKIKDANEVKQSNNLGEPLVYHSAHDFTKSIGDIASAIIGDNFVLSEPEKKGMLSKLFGGKKRKK